MFNKIKNYFTAIKIANQLTQKDWADKWKKGIESNLFQLYGSTKPVVEPQRDSVVIYTCLKIISETFATTKIDLLLNNTKVKNENDPIYQFLNRLDYEFWEKTSLLFALRGEVFLYLNQSLGQIAGTSKLPAEIIPLDGKHITEVFNDKRQIIGWKYNNKLPIGLDEVIHIKNTNTVNPYRGLSPIQALQMLLDTDKFMQEYSKQFFINGAMPSGIITMSEEQDDSFDEMRKLKELWENEHGGVANAKKTGILKYGMKYEPVAISQQEMDFINGRNFNKNEIITAMGVPGTFVNTDVKGAWEQVKVDERKLWLLTIQPICYRFQQKLNNELFDKYTNGYSMKYNFDNIVALQDDYSKRTEQATKLFMLGYTRNEINQSLNLGFEDSEDGDTRYIPVNLIPEDQQLIETPSYDEVSDEKMINITPNHKRIEFRENKSARNKRILAKFERIHSQHEKQLYSKLKAYFYKQRKEVLTRLSNQKKSTLEQYLIYNSINIIDDETKKLVNLAVPLFSEIVKDGQEFAFEQLNIDREVILNNELVQKRTNLLTNVVNTVFNQIKMEINDGINKGETIDDITARIKSVYNTTQYRARTIARTETTSLLNQASLSEYLNNGVSKKEWITAGDENVRESCRKAQEQGPIQINQPFHHGLMHPSEPNCRCTVSPVIE